MKIGIDMTYVPRFLNKKNLAKKILNEDEYFFYLNSKNKSQYLASRFALKEALIKCLELDILSVNLNEINTIKKDNGAVYIKFKDKNYNCSLSHEKDYCIGVVIDA